jgi:hypothetical protein
MLHTATAMLQVVDAGVMEAEVIEVTAVLVVEDAAVALGIPSQYVNFVRKLDIRW